MRRRGVDLISANPDTGPYGGHGTSVAGIAVGGIAGMHRLAGIAPDAEMIFCSIEYNASPRFFTGLPAMMLWAEAEGADVMLYEDGEWVWEYLDGSSNEEVMINEMAAKGIIQVCPAGNLTRGGMQTTVIVPAQDSLTVTFTGGSSSTVWPSLRWFSNIGDVVVRLQGGLVLVLKAQDVPIDNTLFQALGLIFVEFMVITAVALLCSTFTSATLSAIFTLAVYVIVHLTADLKMLGAKTGEGGQVFLNGLYYVLPNLERFNLKGHVTHHLEVQTAELPLIVAYGLAYIALLLVSASVIFQRRDFR